MSNNPKLATEKQVQDVSNTFAELFNHQGKQIKNLESGVIDAIEPSSPAPTKRGEYKVTKPGIYLNFKDGNGQPISVTEEDYSSGNVSIIFNGTDNRKLVVPITFEGEIKEGETRGVSGMTVLKVTEYISDRTISVDRVKSDISEVCNNFLELIKCIKIYSINSNINKDSLELSYIGWNKNNKKFLIQLKYDGKYTTFYMPQRDNREIDKGKEIHLFNSEDDNYLSTIIDVSVVFSSKIFPSDSALEGSIHSSLKLTDNAFVNDRLNYSYTYSNNGTENSNIVILKSFIKNIYLFSNKGIDISDSILTYTGLNYYDDTIILQFKVSDLDGVKKAITFKTKENNLSKYIGSLYKMPIVEDGSEYLNEDIQCVLEFDLVEKSPTISYLLHNDGMFKYLELTNKCFTIPRNNRLFLGSTEYNSVKTTNIYVSQEKDGDNAIQLALDKIKDAGPTNRYVIHVAKGLYQIKSKEQFIGYPGYPAMILAKSHIDIIGEDINNTIIYASLENSPGEPIDKYQTLYNWADDCIISNMTFIAVNLRYTLHQDNGNESNKTRYYDNVNFIYLGNKGYNRALGIGTWSGSKTYLKGGKSQSQEHVAFSVHNNIDFDKYTLWSFKNHLFENITGYQGIIEINNCGSNQPCEVRLEGCNFSGSKIINYREYWLLGKGRNEHFNHSNYRLTGQGNAPFFFNNGVVGAHLALKTKDIGSETSIVIDVNSTAYTRLIANARGNYFGNIGNPNIEIKDKHLIKKGCINLSAYAYGCVSILDKYYWPDNNNWTDKGESIGKVLGDCSGSKAIYLDVTINGIKKTILFNENYNDKTQDYILTHINGFISDVAECYIANIGADYYPEMSDVVSLHISNSNTLIKKGTLVTLKNNRIEPCNEEDDLFGLLIDDLSSYELDDHNVVKCKGRVINNCYVTTTQGNISSVRTQDIGDRYKVVDGVLVADPNGTIKSMAGLILI